MGRIGLLYLLLFTSVFSFGQDDEDDYLCEKLTKDQGIGPLILNVELDKPHDFMVRDTAASLQTSCYSCGEDRIWRYTVDPSLIQMEEMYGLTTEWIDVFVSIDWERDENDELFPASYIIQAVVFSLADPETQDELDDFQTGLFNDYYPILDTYAIT